MVCLRKAVSLRKSSKEIECQRSNQDWQNQERQALALRRRRDLIRRSPLCAERAHALAHENDIMEGGKNGESEGHPQEQRLSKPHPLGWHHQKQHDEEYSGNLGEGIHFAKNAGPEIAQPGGRVEYGAHAQNANIAAEHDYGVSPLDEMENRQHHEQHAQQQFVRDRVQILANACLLMQLARQEAVEQIRQSGDDQKHQGLLVFVVDQAEHDEGDKHHAQQGELVRGSQNVRELQAPGPTVPRSKGATSTPASVVKRWAREGSPLTEASISMRSTRCMGKKTTPGV